MSDPLDATRVGSSLDELEFLARSAHRVAVLDAVAGRPHTRAELRALTGASASTVGRTLSGFEDRCWVERTDRGYVATPLGAFVVEGVTSLLDRMDTERALREVWRWLPTDEIGLDVDLFADAVVTVPEFGSPHRTVDRFTELVEESDTLQGFTPTTVDSDMEVLLRNAIDGMEAEVVWPPDLADTVLDSQPDRLAEALESGNLTVLTNGEIPCACGLFDDRVGLAGYDRETGMMRATVDTDDPEARRWAEDLYSSYRRDARRLRPEAIFD